MEGLQQLKKDMPNSLPYQDFLISRLKDPNYAAVYLETHMELEENEELDPRLIKLALSNVALALGEQNNMAPEQVKQHQEKLDALLAQRADQAIYPECTMVRSIRAETNC